MKSQNKKLNLILNNKSQNFGINNSKLFDASEQFLSNLFKPKKTENSMKVVENHDKKLNTSVRHKFK